MTQLQNSVRISSMFVLSLLASGALGQTSQPTVDAILNKYVEASGGKAAFEKIRNRVSRGSFEIPAQGLKGSIVVYEVAPNTQRAIIELAGIGRDESGTDGTTAFQSSTMSGSRLLQGEERAAALRQSVFSAPVKLREMYKSIAVMGDEEVDKRPTWKLLMTPETGNPETWYFDKATGLLARIDIKMPVQGAVQDMQSYLSEYRKADGLMLPYMTRQKIGGAEQVIRVDSVAHNVEIPKEALEFPKEIKALVAKEKGGPAATKPVESREQPKSAKP